jgi:hypothetical protein
MKTILTLIVAVTITQPVAVEAQNVAVKWSVLSGGFTLAPAQAGRMLTMSAGQTFVEVSSGSNRIVESGFLVHPVLRGILVSVLDREELPISFALLQNYPNPFNPSTSINYQLPTQSHVTLKVFDLLGREVATLVNGVEEPGFKSVQWNATNFASGAYFYGLDAGSFTTVKKLLLLK